MAVSEKWCMVLLIPFKKKTFHGPFFKVHNIAAKMIKVPRYLLKEETIKYTSFELVIFYYTLQIHISQI